MFEYLIFMAPFILLVLWAQNRVSSAFRDASQVPARMNGATAARQILDSAGLNDVGIEQVSGHLSDHYDPRDNVLRLSQPVYSGYSQAAVGIAAHEAGHAIQKAQNYAPLVIRSMAVPVARFGGGNGWWILMVLGAFLQIPALVLLGLAAFAGYVLFQIINLPVEFDASSRAKAQLVDLGIVGGTEMTYVNKVLNAAAMTYVAGTLQSIGMLLYYIGLARD